MHSQPTPFDSNAQTGSSRAIIRRNPYDASEVEMVEAVWGSNPPFADGTSFRFVRSEGRLYPGQRCLISASEFHMGYGDKRYRVTLESGNFFYLAAVWEPAMGEWPLSYPIVAVPANLDICQYQERRRDHPPPPGDAMA